jgi:hypothetical protein
MIRVLTSNTPVEGLSSRQTRGRHRITEPVRPNRPVGTRRRYLATALLLGTGATAVALVVGLLPSSASASGTRQEQPAVLPAYCHSGGATLWAGLATCGWPDASNTGPNMADCPNGLTSQGDGTTPIVITTDYEVISCANLLGPVDIEAAGVTIKDSVVTTANGTGASGTGAITNAVGSSATISHVTINGDDTEAACIWHEGTQLVVTAVNCYGADDGIFAWPASGSATSGNNYLITDSYFHDFTTATGNGHEDGFQTEGTSYGMIYHNTFQMTAGASSAIGIWDSRRSANDITVTDNLITGGAFAIYAEDYSPGDGAPGDPSPAGGFDVTNIVVDDNTFSTEASGCVGRYGVWFTRPAWAASQGGPTDGWHRLGNVVTETGQNVDNTNPDNNGQLCR